MKIMHNADINKIELNLIIFSVLKIIKFLNYFIFKYKTNFFLLHQKIFLLAEVGNFGQYAQA